MKKVICLMLICTLVLSFAGCTSKKSTANGNKIKLTYSFWEPGIEREVETTLKKVIDNYSKLKPNVEIELLAQPVSGYQEWLQAQIAAGTVPDIQSNHANFLDQQYTAGVVVDITDGLNAPNPYNNNKIWKDSFIDGRLDQVHSYKYQPTYAIPLFGTGLAMFYNKTIYKQLGLSVPNTWDEFINNCKAIEKANIAPIALMAQKKDAVQWLAWEFTGGLFAQKILADANLNYNGDCAISNNEMIKSVEAGYYDLTKNKEYREMYKTYLSYLKDYVQYAPNASGLDESAAKTMFLSGKAAHIHTGSWDIKGLMANENAAFETGTFPFPSFTKENSKYAGKGMVTASAQPVALTSSVLKQEGKKEAAIDFLMYLTSPDVHKMFTEETYQIPVVKDVDIDPMFNGFLKEGYPPIHLFIRGSEKAEFTHYNMDMAIISGETFPNEDAMIDKTFEASKMWCEEYKANNKLSAEGDYKIPELPLVNGKFVPAAN